MKLPDPLLAEIVRDIAGNEGVTLINLIKDKENYSEFKMAERLGITINQVRNVLYKLSEKGLLTSTRKKEKEKGWYVYYWTLDKNKVCAYVIHHKQQKIAQLQHQIAVETTTTFYRCPTGCIRVAAEQALELNYQCNECGKVLVVDELGNRIEKMQRMIQQHQQDIETVKQLQLEQPKVPIKSRKEKKKKHTRASKKHHGFMKRLKSKFRGKHRR